MQEPDEPAPLHVRKASPRRLVVTHSKGTFGALGVSSQRQGRQTRSSTAAAAQMAALPEHEPLQSQAAAAVAGAQQQQQGMVRSPQRQVADHDRPLQQPLERRQRPKAQSAPVRRQLAFQTSPVTAAGAPPKPPTAPTPVMSGQTAMPLQWKTVSPKQRSTRRTASPTPRKTQLGPLAAAHVSKRPRTIEPGSLHAPVKLPPVKVRVFVPPLSSFRAASPPRNAISSLPPAELLPAAEQDADKGASEVLFCQPLPQFSMHYPWGSHGCFVVASVCTNEVYQSVGYTLASGTHSHETDSVLTIWFQSNLPRGSEQAR